MQSVIRIRGFVAAVATLGLLGSASQAGAETFTPTRFDDPIPNKCKQADCSLREAIRAANNKNGRDTVLLAKGKYNLELTATDSGGATGQLFSADPLKLRGVGHRKTKIDANGIDRVLAVGGRASIKAMTLTGGDAGANAFHDSRGGAILSVADKLSLSNVVLKDNTAQFGGAISAAGAELSIKKSTVTDNNASEGGGIHLPPAFGNSPVTHLRFSTVSGNTAAKGGGILADGAAGPGPEEPILQGFNSTVAGNTASGDGGGVLSDNGASVIFSNSTIAYNTADVDNTGGGAGGGVAQNAGAFFNIYDSIVDANQHGSSGSDPSCAGSFAGDGNILAGSAGCGSLVTGANEFVGSASIGPLANNGGPTKTIALLAGSSALGFAMDCPATDQRGVKRPNNCDSGAYERKGQ